MRSVKAWLTLLLAGAFYLVVILPMEQRSEELRSRGRELEPSVRGVVQSLTREVTHLRERLETRSAEMASRFGRTVVSGPEGVSLDSLLDAVHRACGEAGGALLSAVPMPPQQASELELAGLRCVLDLPGEDAFARFLEGLARRGRAPAAMWHQCDVARGTRSLRIEITISTLRATDDDPRSRSVLDAWASIRRAASPPEAAWLLQKRPRAGTDAEVRQAARPAPPPPPPVNAPVPRPPPFLGRLVGVTTSADGRDLAIIELHGRERVLATGETLDGWTLSLLAVDHVQMTAAGSVQSLWFSEAERQVGGAGGGRPAAASETAPNGPTRANPGSSPDSAGSLLAGAPPRLGFSARLVLPGPEHTCPPPYEELRWVHEVTSVEQGSPAGRSGLRPGDHLLALDGAPLLMGEQLSGLRARMAAGGESVLTLERNGSLLSISLGD